MLMDSPRIILAAPNQAWEPLFALRTGGTPRARTLIRTMFLARTFMVTLCARVSSEANS